MSIKNEILAPVGNSDMLYAAVSAGADAVYLGGKFFSARERAVNFTIDEIKEIVQYCHFENVKVYITLNTLLKDTEILDAMAYAQELYLCDVDALIVQDLGLIHLLRKYLPDFMLHASTQMNIHSVYGAALMKNLGFSRVVLARETTMEEIRKIKQQVDIELEVFVHGSLCVCESGQCLMSSMIGDRSGNRGRCAQPCRKSYALYDKNKKKRTEPLSLLSPKDLRTLEYVDEMKDVIDSFKIEGRMKKREYVYATVKSYQDRLSKKDSEDLLEEVRIRHFTKGLLWNAFGKNYAELHRDKMIKGSSVGTITTRRSILLHKEVSKEDRCVVLTENNRQIPLTITENAKAGEEIRYANLFDAKIGSTVVRSVSKKLSEEAGKQKRHIENISLHLTCRIGELPKLSAQRIEVMGIRPVTVAKSRPIDLPFCREQLQKLGKTNYALENLTAEIDDGAFLSKKDLNDLRRQLVKKLWEKQTNWHHRKEKSFMIYSHSHREKRISWEFVSPKERFEMPRYSSSAIYEELSQEKIKETKISCHNIGDIAFVKKFFPQKHCIADVGLNIFNQYAADFLKELGVTHMVVSPELTKQEMLQLVDHAEGDFEVIGKDKITDMVTVYCPASSVMPCDKQCENCPWNRTFLKDAEGEFYEVVRKRNYSKIYHSSHLDITDCLEELQGHNIHYVRVSEENFNTKKTIGHFRKGIL